jgi:hypothetical protein
MDGLLCGNMADDIKWIEQKEHSEESGKLQQDVELQQHKQVSP